MFVRVKQQGNYLVANKRVGSKVRQKTIAYLGEYATLDQAIEGLFDAISTGETKAAELWAEVEKWKQQIPFGACLCPKRDGVPIYVTRSSGNYNHDPARRYWRARREAESYERWARSTKARLEKLRDIKAAV